MSTTPSEGRRLEGRRALITGAARGQGRAVAARFAAEGARVIVSDRDAEAVDGLVGELRATGAEATAVVADVRDEAQVERVVACAVESLGGLDVLYNNAGVYWTDRDGPVDRLPRDVWDDVMAINATGSYLFCRYAVPHLLASGSGVILNVSSVAGYAGDPDCHAYAASKGALIALTASLAQRYGPQGLRAVALCPGFIETPMTSSFLGDASVAGRIAGATALRRVGTADEVATVAAFLASDEAAFVTSVVVPVHGGLVK
jgi:NAD(P)-dependent dehydrogenase (short-subunit alcohol dehydrogenase family)